MNAVAGHVTAAAQDAWTLAGKLSTEGRAVDARKVAYLALAASGLAGAVESVCAMHPDLKELFQRALVLAGEHTLDALTGALAAAGEHKGTADELVARATGRGAP